MLHSRHTSRNSLLLISPLILGLVTALASCGESKVSQCNKLVAEINQGQAVYQKSADAMKGVGGFNPTKPEEMKAQVTKVKESLGAFVADIRKVKEGIKALAVEDKKLLTLRDDYATQLEAISVGFEGSSKAISSLGAINFTGADAVKQVETSTKEIGDGIQKVSKAGQESNRVVGEINTYCSAK
jgi:methyl-accepting chemotaxis protein